MIASVLVAEGYEVIEARDGSELIGRLHDLASQPRGRERLAVIISDVRMPRVDGLDMLAALRCARYAVVRPPPESHRVPRVGAAGVWSLRGRADRPS